MKSPPNSVRVFHAPWQTAVDETLTARRIRAEERDCDGYVWENPPIVLKVPLLHAKYTYVDDTPRTHEVFGATLDTEGEEDYVSMVPYGCTNLRITYLPRATPKK